MNPVNRKPSMFQTQANTQALPGALPAPMPLGGLMRPMRPMQSMQSMQPSGGAFPGENLSDKSLMESDPNAIQADPDMMAKQEAGFLPANMHCETCAHMDNAICTKYGFPVADEDGCSQGYESVGEIIDTPLDDSGESVGMESPEVLEGEPSTDEEEIPEEETNPVDEESEEENIGKGGKKSMKPVTGKGGKK